MTNPVSSATQPRRPRRWRWPLLCGVAVLVLASGGGVLFYLHHVNAANQELQDALAELDRTDPLWRYEDVEAGRKTPPEGRNSADVVATAYRLLPAQFPSLEWSTAPGAGLLAGDAVAPGTRYENWPRNVRFDPALTQALRRELLAADQGLVAARRLAEMPEGRFVRAIPLDYVGDPAPHHNQARAVVWLLNADAASRAAAGDMAAAWESVRAAVNAGRSVGDEPTVLGHVVRNGAVWSAITGLERVLAHGEVASKDLLAMRELLDREEREVVPNLVTAIRGERALLFRLGDAIASGQLKGVELGGEPFKDDSHLPDGIRARANSLWLRRSFARLLRESPKIIAVPQAPTNEWRERLQNAFDDTAMREDKTLNLTGWLASGMGVGVKSALRQLAVTRSARVALAAEQFRKEKGRWPERLADLTADYLKAIPEDPYDGQPLRMKRTEDGLTIYSVANDGTDNGGELDPGDLTPPGSDLGFRLWDMNRRGLPPEKARP